MTLCIGWQCQDGAVLYADGKVINEGGPSETTRDKIFRAHGATWAYCGDLSVKQYLTSVGTRPYGPRNRMPFDVWWHRSVAAELSQRYSLLHSSGTPARFGESFGAIAVTRGRLWELATDFCMSPTSREYLCIGSGSQYAYGALEFALRYDEDLGTDRIIEIFEIVSELDPGVGPPFYRCVVTADGAGDLEQL